MPDWSDTFRALRHRDFRLYTFGQTVSITGSWMQGVAQSWLIYRLTHSESMMGATLFATHIPVLLLGPLGGFAADRIPRKHIVLTTQFLALVQALLLAILNLTGKVTPTHVLILAVCLGIVNAFDIPARQTLFIQMVGRSDLISAISLNSAIFNGARVVGPSIAGIIVGAFGETVCFFINAASFIAMILCVGWMRLPNATHVSMTDKTRRFSKGFHYAWSNRSLRVLLAASALMNLCYGPLLALMPFFADSIFHKGSQGLGFLFGFMGVGAVIGVLELARHKGIGELPGMILQCMLLMAGALIALALSPWFGLSLVLMLAVGFSVMRQNAAGNSLLQTTAPDEYRGRLMALYSMVVTGLMPIGSLTAGFLAEHFGARAVVFGAAICCLAGGIAYRSAMFSLHLWVKQHEEHVCVV